ncbi:hypothetical protein ACI2JA_06515 [Alkalihalobacillus sp. NPDC078783]
MKVVTIALWSILVFFGFILFDFHSELSWFIIIFSSLCFGYGLDMFFRLYQSFKVSRSK